MFFRPQKGGALLALADGLGARLMLGVIAAILGLTIAVVVASRAQAQAVTCVSVEFVLSKASEHVDAHPKDQVVLVTGPSLGPFLGALNAIPPESDLKGDGAIWVLHDELPADEVWVFAGTMACRGVWVPREARPLLHRAITGDPA